MLFSFRPANTTRGHPPLLPTLPAYEALSLATAVQLHSLPKRRPVSTSPSSASPNSNGTPSTHAEGNKFTEQSQGAAIPTEIEGNVEELHSIVPASAAPAETANDDSHLKSIAAEAATTINCITDDHELDNLWLEAIETLTKTAFDMQKIPAETIGVPHTTDSSISSKESVLASPSNPPKRGRNTQNDPNFVQTYFSSSRLHWIGSWKREFTTNWLPEFQQIRPLFEFQYIPSSTLNPSVYVFHIDMDCFFAAVAVRHNPSLQGKPVAVCHSNAPTSSTTNDWGTSCISSANYEARAFGLHANMLVQRAFTLCPELQVVPYDFPSYETVSKKVYQVFFSYTSHVEAVSCDEAYLLVPSRPDINPIEIANRIRADIYLRTQCNASAGISHSKFCARLATKIAKPNNAHYVPISEIPQFLSPLEVRELPGVGYALSKRLIEANIPTVFHLRKSNLETLKSLFGNKTGTMLYHSARGDDHRVFVGCLSDEMMKKKSIGATVNFGIRFNTMADAHSFFRPLTVEVLHRLHSVNMSANIISLKIKKRAADAPIEPMKFMGHGVCDNYNKSRRLATALSGTDETTIKLIYRIICELFDEMAIEPDWVRGVGIHFSQLKSLSKSINSSFALNFSTGKSIPRHQNHSSSLIFAEDDDLGANGSNSPNLYSFEYMNEEKIDHLHETNQLPGTSHDRSGDRNSNSSVSNAPSDSIQQFFPIVKSMGIVKESVPDTSISTKADKNQEKNSSLLQELIEESNVSSIPSHPNPSFASTRIIPSTSSSATNLPLSSLLDADVIASLPAEIRAELRLEYARLGQSHPLLEIEKPALQEQRKNGNPKKRKRKPTIQPPAKRNQPLSTNHERFRVPTSSKTIATHFKADHNAIPRMDKHEIICDASSEDESKEDTRTDIIVINDSFEHDSEGMNFEVPIRNDATSTDLLDSLNSGCVEGVVLTIDMDHFTRNILPLWVNSMIWHASSCHYHVSTRHPIPKSIFKLSVELLTESETFQCVSACDQCSLCPNVSAFRFLYRLGSVQLRDQNLSKVFLLCKTIGRRALNMLRQNHMNNSSEFSLTQNTVSQSHCTCFVCLAGCFIMAISDVLLETHGSTFAFPPAWKAILV